MCSCGPSREYAIVPLARRRLRRPPRGTWRQHWVSVNYSIEIEGGLDEEGRMVLVGELHHYGQRAAIPFRGTWTPRPDGSVRQLFEQQDPATSEWQVWFDGRYERRAPG